MESPIDASYYVRTSGATDRTSAGGIVVRVEQGQTLVALVTEPGFGFYVLPKGGVEKDEDLETAARREIQEEAGLTDLTLLASLGTRARLNWNKKRWITTHYFLFVTRQTEAAPTDPYHDYQTHWFPLDALPPFYWPDQHELLLENSERILRLKVEM